MKGRQMIDAATQVNRVTGIAVLTASIGYIGSDPVIMAGGSLMMAIALVRLGQLLLGGLK